MRKHLIAATAIALGLLATQASADIYVICGDTIIVDGERIRLVGLDAPETTHARCGAERRLGFEAKARLHDILTAACGPLAEAPASCLAIECQHRPDRYGRTVALVLADGVDPATSLISQGLARAYRCNSHCPPRRPWCEP